MAIDLLRSSSEFLLNGDIISYADPYTLSLWFYMEDETANQAVMGMAGYNHGSALYMTSAGVLTFGTNTYGTTTGSTLSFDTWYHCVQRRNGDYCETFIDGVSAVSQSTHAQFRYDLSIGRRGHSSFGNMYLTGRIAAVKFWGQSLTLAEIQQEIDFFVPGRTNDLLAWSPFVADETVNFRDYSGNGNDWSETGTIEAGAGPPITWRKGASKIFVPTAVAEDLSHVAALAESFDNVVQRRPSKVTSF